MWLRIFVFYTVSLLLPLNKDGEPLGNSSKWILGKKKIVYWRMEKRKTLTLSYNGWRMGENKILLQQDMLLLASVTNKYFKLRLHKKKTISQWKIFLWSKIQLICVLEIVFLNFRIIRENNKYVRLFICQLKKNGAMNLVYEPLNNHYIIFSNHQSFYKNHNVYKNSSYKAYCFPATQLL